MLRPVEKGILFAVAAFACYALAALFVKTVTLSYPLIVFMRNAIGLLVFLPFFLKNKEELKTKRLPFHCLRVILSLATIYCSTYGIQRLHLGDAILLEQTAPFFILAILFFKGEKISFLNLMALLTAFAGVGYILKPHFDVWQLRAIASLGAGLFAALSILAMQSLGKTETSLSTLFYFLLLSTLLSMGPTAGHWTEISSWQQGLFLLLIGIFFAIFQYFLTHALTLANAQVVGSYSYFTAIFSIILGIVFLEEKFTFSRMIGTTLIIGAGLYIYYEKRMLAKKKEEQG